MTAIPLTYEPDGLTLEEYLMSQSRVTLIQGPRGSGKSRASCFKLVMEAMQQEVNPATGKRHVRTYVIRRTFDELYRTTIQTWLGGFKEEFFGPLKRSKPFVHHIQVGDLDWEVTFLALDSEADREKLKSAEISSAWVNEFSEIERGVIDDLEPCLGRYPSKADGGCTRPFIIGDTNPGEELHWFSIMSEQTPMPDNATADQRRTYTKPDSWKILVQPAAMFEVLDPANDNATYMPNPDAENMKWLPKGYYANMIQGKARNWIRRNICNKPASTQSGDPVWPEFQEHVHVSKGPIEAVAGHPILIGVDFGRTPAAVLAQRVFDRWVILSEVYATNTGARKFAQLLRRHLAERYPGFKYQIWGDPAGDNLGEADDISPFMMFRAEGLGIHKAPTNDPTVRIEAVAGALREMVDGRPRFLMSSNCIALKAAMNGGYRYADRSERQTEAASPLKNKHSHVADALEYVLIGAGEGRQVLHGQMERPKPRVVQPQSNVMQRRQGRFGPSRSIFQRRGR